MNPATKWIVAIVGLLGVNVLATGVLIAASHSGGTSQVIPRYYDQAVHYDDAIDQARANVALGWTVSAAAAGALVVHVRDADGRPLAGAEVSFEGYPRAHAARRVAGTFAAIAPGEYRAPAIATGWNDLTITVVRGAQRFVERVTVEEK